MDFSALFETGDIIFDCAGIFGCLFEEDETSAIISFVGGAFLAGLALRANDGISFDREGSHCSGG